MSMKHFSLLSSILSYLHWIRTFSRFIMASSEVTPNVVKSSVYISMQSCDISTKILIIAHWNVAGALHRSNGKIKYAKLPHGHVNVVFS